MVLVESCTSPWPVSVIGWLPLLLTVLVTVNDVPLLMSIEPAAEMAPKPEIRLPLFARPISPVEVATSVPAVTRLPTAWLMPLVSWSVSVPLVSMSPARLIVLLRGCRHRRA